MQRRHGVAASAAGFALVFVFFACDGTVRGAAALALVAALGASFALAVRVVEPSDAAGPAIAGRRLGALAAAIAATFGALVLAVQGRVPGAGALVTAGVVAALLAARRVVPGRFPAWLVPALVGTALTVPTLGSIALLDPWETHYGEVAREMIARDDALSPFWAHEGWFRSKPVLDFWLQTIALRVTEASWAPGHVLDAAHLARPEWALRFPSFALALAGSSLLVVGVARTFGRRAACFGGVVLWTCPQWLFLARQSITDMPLVACMAGSFGLMLLALDAAPAAPLRGVAVAFGRHRLVLDARHAVITALAALVVPQALYCISRNVELCVASSPHGVRVHADEFFLGSAGNETLPGQVHHAVQHAAHPWWAPSVVAILALAALVLVVDRLRQETTVRPVLFAGAWLFAAVATMGKGPVGFVLPLATLLAFVLVSRRFDLIAAARLGTGLGLIALVVLPWYLALYGRHGRAFVDELVFVHMIGRTVGHLHDTNQGDDTGLAYFVWQLGYALAPWLALVPTALALTAARPVLSRRGATATFLGLATLLAFGLVSVMRTKFHHYVFPVVPPVAMLVGVAADDVLRGRRHGALLAAGALLTAFVALDFFTPASIGGVEGQGRLLHLFTYLYRRAWPTFVDLRLPLAGLVVASLAATVLLHARRTARLGVRALGASALAFAAFIAFVYLPAIAPHRSQRTLVERFEEQRTSPDEPLVAYQMNWKGENFYTGNRLAIFVQTGAPFVEWVRGRLRGGARSMLLVAEHQRVGNLRAELGHAEAGGLRLTAVEPLTTREDNHEFALVRARFE